MWPWGHLAVGYLSYTTAVHLFRTSHDRVALVALVVGTQFPDLVDKPLAWVGVLAYGRALAHSLLVLVPLCALVLFVARRQGRGRTGGAFVLGALSHVVSDAWDGLLALDVDRMSFLLWPFVPSPDTDVRGTPTGHARRLASEVDTQQAGTDGFLDVVQSEPAVQACFLLAAVGVWVAEGAPGWEQ